MRKTNTELQKKREMLVGEYFARAEGLKGKLVSNDKPDIDYRVDGKITGIELTELAPHDSKTRLPGVYRVLERCKALHIERQYPPTRCFVDFDTTYRIKKIEADRCAESLMETLRPVLQQFDGNREIKLNDRDLCPVYKSIGFASHP